MLYLYLVEPQVAERRRSDAESALAGPEGHGRWRVLVAQLVARRSALVAQLLTAYQVRCALLKACIINLNESIQSNCCRDDKVREGFT